MDRGIETIYQYNSMVPTMTIARNLFIGREPLKASLFGVGIMDQKRMREESVKAIADVDLHLRSPDALVGELSGGQRQGVAIARAMHFKSKVLILDEPTNHLSVKETNKVIGFVRGLKAQGVTGIFICHNMQHVFQCCDRVVAMARGEIVFDQPIAETSIDEVHELLVRASMTDLSAKTVLLTGGSGHARPRAGERRLPAAARRASARSAGDRGGRGRSQQQVAPRMASTRYVGGDLDELAKRRRRVRMRWPTSMAASTS